MGANGFYHNGKIYIDTHAGANNTMQEDAVLLTAAHELTHFIRDSSPSHYETLKEFVTEKLVEQGYDFDYLVKHKMQQNQGVEKFSEDSAVEEVVADACEMVLKDSKAVQQLAEEKPSLFKRIRDWLKRYFADIKKAFEGVEARHEEARAMTKYMDELVKLWDDAFTAAAKHDVGRESATTKDSDAKYSLREFEGGRRYVEVDIEQGQFDGLSLPEQQKLATQVIKKKFAGKVIGINNRAFVNGRTATEYARPAKSIKDDAVREAKMRASTELDNLLEAGTNFRKEPDGKYGHVHDKATGGFNYFDTIFKVGTQYYEGVINIIVTDKGRRIKDITKIRNVTKDIVSSYGETPKSNFLSDTSIGSIRRQDQNVKFSMRDNLGRILTSEQQEYFKDSKALDTNGNLRVMYRGGNGDFTVFDRKKSSYSNLYGKGFYFTDSAAHASQYGTPREFYLNIKEPVSTTAKTITKNQMRKFIKAVADNEDDYSFENYGYGATVNSVLNSVLSGKSDFAMLYDVSLTAIGDMVAAVEFFNEVNGTSYDGFILDTETVVFSPNQIKRTDNKEPTDSPDIRYSLRDSSVGLTAEEAREQSKAYTRLKAENAALQRRLDYWKGQSKKSKQASVRKTDTDRYVNQLLKQWGSKADKTSLQAAMQELGNYLVRNNGENLSYEELHRRAAEIAEEVLDGVEAPLETGYEDVADEILRELRARTFRIPAQYLKDLPENFRKEYKGKLHISTGRGTGVDVAYQELQETYGYDLFPVDVINPADQMIMIADAYDRLQPELVNPFEHNMNEMILSLAEAP